jgi:hypothetical protein
MENIQLTLAQIKQTIQAQKPYLAEKYGVTEIGLFGSYVRGEARPDSDLDVLVEFVEYPSLLEFIYLEDELSETLGIQIDLVMKTGLKPRLGQHILQEVVYL